MALLSLWFTDEETDSLGVWSCLPSSKAGNASLLSLASPLFPATISLCLRRDQALIVLQWCKNKGQFWRSSLLLEQKVFTEQMWHGWPRLGYQEITEHVLSVPCREMSLQALSGGYSRTPLTSEMPGKLRDPAPHLGCLCWKNHKYRIPTQTACKLAMGSFLGSQYTDLVFKAL